MKKLILSLMLGVLMFSVVSATSITYSFNSTYEGINMFAYFGENKVDSPPPTNSVPPSGFDVVEITNQDSLDSSDNNYYVGADSDNYFIMAKNILSIDKEDIDNVVWTFEGHREIGSVPIYFYLWNFESSNWYQCNYSVIGTSDGIAKCSINDYSNYLDSEDNSYFLAYFDNSQPVYFDTDFISMEVNGYFPGEPTDCDYYVGDDEFDLPQIDIQGVYTNNATHQSYLACLYNLDGTGNYEVMSLTDSCRNSLQSFNPNIPGEHTYNLNIAYMVRDWNPIAHTWETTDSGTDNSFDYSFTVCDIPQDTEGFDSFISWLQGLLCSLFGWFC